VRITANTLEGQTEKLVAESRVEDVAVVEVTEGHEAKGTDVADVDEEEDDAEEVVNTTEEAQEVENPSQVAENHHTDGKNGEESSDAKQKSAPTTVQAKSVGRHPIAPAPSPGFPICYICGSKTKALTKPDAEVKFPGVPKPVACYKLEYGGLNGFISPSQCPMIPFFKVPLTCGCAEATETEVKELEAEHEEEAVESVSPKGPVEVEVVETKGSTEAEVEVKPVENSHNDTLIEHNVKDEVSESHEKEDSPKESTKVGGDNNGTSYHKGHNFWNSSQGSPGYAVCYICGSAKLTVARPQAKLVFYGNRSAGNRSTGNRSIGNHSIACSRLEYGGLNGYIKPEYCPKLISERVPETCGCEPIAWHTNSTSESEDRDDNE
jgi:hypothetical protein